MEHISFKKLLKDNYINANHQQDFVPHIFKVTVNNTIA